MLDLNGLKKYNSFATSELLPPIATENDMLDACFERVHTYKFVLNAAVDEYGSGISRVEIFTNKDADYLVMSKLISNSDTFSQMDVTGNTNKKYVFPLTISATSCYNSGYQVRNSFLQGGNSWVWLSRGTRDALTYDFDCKSISTFRFQPNWNGFKHRSSDNCYVTVYCDGEQIFYKYFTGLGYVSRINLKFSDYRTCTDTIDNGPGDWF